MSLHGKRYPRVTADICLHKLLKTSYAGYFRSSHHSLAIMVNADNLESHFVFVRFCGLVLKEIVVMVKQSKKHNKLK